MRHLLVALALLVACTSTEPDPSPDAAPVEPDAAVIACEDLCGEVGYSCDPEGRWRCNVASQPIYCANDAPCP